MSSVPANPLDQQVEPVTLKPQRTLLRRILGDTFMRWGAKVGLLWVIVLVFFGIFAPVVANSHPFLIKINGELSSPMLKHLTPLDVILLVGFFTAVVLLLLRRIDKNTRWIVWGSVLGVTIIASAIFVSPPEVQVYETYREKAAAGEVDFVINAPIPYSPNDRTRDRRDVTSPEGPWWSSTIDEKTGKETYPHNHWLGQDTNYQDIASRMIHASRIALAIGFIATGIAAIIGIIIGGLMGFYAGVVDMIGMRLVEIFEFIPQLFLLLMFVAFFPGDYPEMMFGIRVQRLYMIMIIIGLTSWAGYARFVRAEFLKLRNQDFVVAAKACGLPISSILFRHMLPNGVTPVLVAASFGVASAIISEATLSFLGLGLIEEPSWGQMLDQARTGSTFIWWIATFPGLAIFLTVFAYNLIGESLRDAIDPYTSRNSKG